MSGERNDLEQIQRWMQSVIMHPGGVAEGVASPEAREFMDVPLAELETVISRSQSLDSQERLSIYVNAYYERLLECLREEYAITCQVLGEDLFDGLAFGYLQQYPSRSYTLGELGAKFPAFLAEARLHAGQSPHGSPANWTEFINELARFERLQREVFDGPGTERGTVAAPAVLVERAERIDQHRFSFNPSLRVAQFSHPVLLYWTALKSGEAPIVPQSCASYLAVFRTDYVVQRRELEPAEYELLSGLISGTALEDALMAIADDRPTDELAQSVGNWFGRWTRDGYFVDVLSAN